MNTHTDASTGEFTKAGRKIFSERVRDAQREALQRKLSKSIRKFPPTADTFTHVAIGDTEMRIMSGLGWEVIQAPVGGLYRSPINRYTMQISRTDYER